jgi:predicted phosphodiesterase
MDREDRRVVAIATADIHISNRQPICRKDSYKDAIIRKLELVKKRANKLGVPVIDSGDVFDRAKPTPEVISIALSHLPNNFITIPGNHDISYHNYDIYKETALYAVSQANTGVKVLTPYETLQTEDFSVTAFPYGFTDLSQVNWEEVSKGKLKIALMHIMTYDGDKPYPQCTDLSAKELCKLLDKFDLVITGHNHQCFTKRIGNTTLLNPGSLMRATSEQINYIPRIWYIMEDGTLEYEEIKVDIECLSNEHIVQQKEVDERMSSFVSNLVGTKEVSLSFTDNLNKYISINQIEQNIKDTINQIIEEVQ